MVETLRLAPQLALRTPDGQAVVLHDVRVRQERTGDQLLDIWLIAELDPATWADVDTHGWFHLAPANRGPVMGGAFDADAPVQLEARLSPKHTTTIAMVADDEWWVLAELLTAQLVPAAHETESWLALTVTQARGRLREGFSTTHFAAR